MSETGRSDDPSALGTTIRTVENDIGAFNHRRPETRSSTRVLECRQRISETLRTDHGRTPNSQFLGPCGRISGVSYG